MRLAMISINKKLENKELMNCNLLLQIHDELIFEVPKD